MSDAETLATGGWILPGLVDAHCHVGLEAAGEVPPERAEEHALADRDAGALLLRDAGSPADTRWIDDREDLPKIIRAGRHIARPKRYMRNFADEVEPADLVATVERQAARGDGWVKIVGDWIDREVGDLTPLWPADIVASAIARAHELGVRVTAHVFGEQAAAELVGAGHRRDRARHRAGPRHPRGDGRARRRAGSDDDPARQLRGVRQRRRNQVPGVRQAHAGALRAPARDVPDRVRARRADLCRHRCRRLAAAWPGRLRDRPDGRVRARRVRPGRRLLAGPGMAGPAG